MKSPIPIRRRSASNPRAAFLLLLSVAQCLVAQPGHPSGRLRIASFNVENYLIRPAPGRSPKPETSREKVAELLAQARPDVVALQEVGDTEAMADLQARLRAHGTDLPHAEFVRGHDPDIAVAILSRFPFASRRHHTNDAYLLDGRRLRSSRAFAEVSMVPSPGYHVHLLVAHLKSKRAVGIAAESEMRHKEAILLREKADAILVANPDANLVVCGDFNDSPDSPALRALCGSGVRALIDTRPAEPASTSPSLAPSGFPRARRVTWTHYFAREDAFTRIDYILVSRGMAREWRPEGTCILTSPDWGMASDHRPIVAEFETTER
jgi:endonuclease/exonuclease/phosphatase family metal-dependent hydrolase